ncbi:MAG: cupin domain-containing protein [Alphaproteobacteria bacterium]
MNHIDRQQVRAAEVVLPCPDLKATLPFFTDTLGFRIDAIFPADRPAIADISGYGVHLRLQRDATGDPGALRLLCPDPDAVAGGTRTLTAPNGTRIELAPLEPPLAVPPVAPALVVTRMQDEAGWGVGRAGMRYRDLVPDRQGGFAIASHIRIVEPGPVPDYVHFHKIRFQMIYCYRGWVRVAYEDQGEPFVLRAGDCVLQPPQIRHRVLESGDGLEVIEVGCPAEHMTCVDHDLTLPTGAVLPDRDFGGQRFVRHVAAEAAWHPWRLDGFAARDTGIGTATGGVAGARVARRTGAGDSVRVRHDAEFLFHFVLQGAMTLAVDGAPPQALATGDSFVVPPHSGHAFTGCSADLQRLVGARPAGFPTTAA